MSMDFDPYKDYFRLADVISDDRQGVSQLFPCPEKRRKITKRKMQGTENPELEQNTTTSSNHVQRCLNFEPCDLFPEQSSHAFPEQSCAVREQFSFPEKLSSLPEQPDNGFVNSFVSASHHTERLSYMQPPPATTNMGLESEIMRANSTYCCHGRGNMLSDFQAFENQELSLSMPNSPDKRVWMSEETALPSPLSAAENLTDVIREFRQLIISMKTVPPPPPCYTPPAYLRTCAFCKQNGERKQYYESHILKDEQGRVICPVLRNYKCPLCNSTGDEAHTAKYCPLNSDQAACTSMPVARLLRNGRNCIGRRRSLSD